MGGILLAMALFFVADAAMAFISPFGGESTMRKTIWTLRYLIFFFLLFGLGQAVAISCLKFMRHAGYSEHAAKTTALATDLLTIVLTLVMLLVVAHFKKGRKRY